MENSFRSMPKEDLFKVRMYLEADTQTDSVFHVMAAGMYDEAASDLAQVKELCDDAEYAVWKEEYISKKLEQLGNMNIITCTYEFAGAGKFDSTMPEFEYESFKAWLNEIGAGIIGDVRSATEDEIKTYIALEAAKDECH